ncbi:uncharacterized protein LOC106054043 [Biomphalaria glabrata]|uniref:Uncharacterized protein LOC106054043 n=1 Tax=Biomphalaria glabrata TaxID=6526 RepID=A0A9W3A263_BIOGL|nr:uncharacterized protein LOC106054043 [Biomphalaria glabrata]
MSTVLNKSTPEYLELIDANRPSQSNNGHPSSNVYLEPSPPNDRPVASTSKTSPTSTTRSIDSAKLNPHISPAKPKSEITGTSPASVTSYNNVSSGSSSANFAHHTPSRALPPIVKRPSHLDLPQHPSEHSDTGTYSQLESVDQYDMSPTRRHILARSPEQSEKSKKFMSLATCCFIFSVAAIFTTILSSILTVGKNIESSLNEKLSSLETLHVQSSKELLEAINKGGCKVTADLIVKYSGTCYCLYKKQLSWNSAREFCLTKGNDVHLAEICKKEDNDFLIPYLQIAKTKQGIWLGASSLSGEWQWNFTGKSIEQFEPSQWDVGQPSSFSPLGHRESCLEVYNWTSPMYKWNDIDCSYAQPFMCSSDESNCCC